MSETQKKDQAESGNKPEPARDAGPAGRKENTQKAEARSGANLDSRDIDLLLDVPLQVSVEVGRTRMLIKDFLQMKEGGVIELDKMADEPLDLYVNSRLIARGEAVVVNEKFGLRLIDVVSPSERIEKLG